MLPYNPGMAKYLDVPTWGRRHLFEFFRHYTNPYFNICAQIDITRLLEILRTRPVISTSLTYLYFALHTANEIEPFRYRLRGDKVLIHDVIHGGTIVLLPNESFNFAYFDYDQDFEKFITAAQTSTQLAQRDGAAFTPNPGDDRIHFSILPWTSFTSFSHARNLGLEDSVPKIAFGKFIKENERTLLPISVEVHHALMDGLHVGRFLTRLQELLQKPEICVGSD
jgi:chloramphenicol O-acetyltransferase type A